MTTESQIDNDVIGVEVAGDVAVSVGEDSSGLTPVRGVHGGAMCEDVMRHWGRTFPKPDANGRICALHGVVPTSVGIEGRSVAFEVRVPDTASDVGVAVCREDSSRQGAFVSTAQKDAKRAYPDEVVLEGIEHPGLVCNVDWLGPWSLTPSTISTSPPFGQVDSSDSQIAGQVPHPSGMCFTSKTAT